MLISKNRKALMTETNSETFELGKPVTWNDKAHTNFRHLILTYGVGPFYPLTIGDSLSKTHSKSLELNVPKIDGIHKDLRNWFCGSWLRNAQQ